MALVGMTGSGKTFFAEYLLRSISRLVVLDPKGALRGKWGLREWSDETRDLLMSGEDVRIRIGQPIDRGTRRALSWESYLWDIYDAGNVLVYLDEVHGVIPVGKKSDALLAIYSRGRELGIGAVSSSQRPSWIPLEILSESSWFVMFRVQLEEDRKRMAGLMGPYVVDPIEDEHGFWAYHVGWKHPYYTTQLEVQRVRARSA